MPSDRFCWTWKYFAAGLCTLALIVGLGENTAVNAGKGSSAVVKASAAASRIDASGKQTVTVTLAVDKGWHIYANPVNHKDYTTVQTVVTVNANGKPAAVKIQYPPGKEQTEGKTTYLVYEDKVTIQAVVTRAAGDTGPLEVAVRFSACHKVRGICYPPSTEKFNLP